DDLHADAIRPDCQLIDGRGAERVRRADHDLLVHLILQQPGELGDARGLSRAVDAGDENYGRAARGEFQLALVIRPPAREDLPADDAFRIGGVFDLPEPPAL